MRRWHLIPLLLLSASCAGEGTPSVDGEPVPPRLPIGGGDGGVECGARPEEGCACDPEREPVDCYLDPVEGPSGGLICNHGTRYCRDATWTGCESLREFTIEGSSSALVTGPTACNPCDPRCFVSRDVPGPLDLPGRSTNVSYDPGTGGITLTPAAATTGTLTDSDGDGVPDIVEGTPACPGARWYRDPATGVCSTEPALYHTLPFGASAIDPLAISTQIRTADVYFLMDTTGSMGGELTRLRTDLTSGTFTPGCTGGIIGAIRCTIPDAWFGVGFHDDYPVNPYGSSGWGDIVYRNTLDIQGSVSAAQTAVNALTLHNGNDGPESQTQALWAIATGGGLSTYLAPRTGCRAGTWGYPCFRDGTIPIVIFITDAPFHNGPSGSYPYNLGGGGSTTLGLPAATGVSGNERQDTSAYPGGGAAIDLTATWVGFSGNTSGMANDVAPGCGGGARDAVFRVRLTSAQTTRFTLEGSSYDTVLGVFPVGGGAGWCNDDAIGVQSQLDLALAAGDYWVVVDGWNANSGAYRLSMGRNPVVTAGFTGASWSDTVAALSARSVKVLTFQTCGSWSNGYCIEGENHARTLANATGSLGSAGSPYVFRGSDTGAGLSATIVNAVLDLANYSRMDVSARVVGDTMGFTVLPIAAISWGAGGCTGISGGSTFTQCLPGTTVNFNVTFRNNVVAQTAVPQVFSFFVEIIGNGTVVLTRVPVTIVVPPLAPTYPPSGTYWREYDTTLRCASNELPDWENLEWVAAVPAGTRIEFEIRAADTLAAVATATPVARVTVPSAVSPVDLATVLRTAGYATGMPFVRVTAVLYANAARTATPTLTSMALTYTCIPGF